MARSPIIFGGGTIGKSITATGTNGQAIITDGAGNLSFGSVPTAYTAPTVQRFTSSGSQTGLLFSITAPTSNVSAGATYTNNGNTYTVLSTVTTAQSGFVLYTSGTGSVTGTTLTKASGTGPTTITFSLAQVLATYTTPTSPTTPLYLRIQVLGGGGGGGGGGSGTGLTAGGTGGFTSFGTAMLGAAGGGGGLTSTPSGGGVGGLTTIGTGPIVLVANQGGGGSAADGIGATLAGGLGGISFFGNAASLNYGIAAASGNTNQGGGGGGGGTTSSGSIGSGGGAGAYIDAIITSPASTYYYSLGAAGSAGAAGASGGGLAGGTGGSGIIIVTEYYE